eukprot:9465373-Pyramimonas_sp.AAC.1
MDTNDDRRRAREARAGEMNFFEAVFSFVFGDGDPNEVRGPKHPLGSERAIRFVAKMFNRMFNRTPQGLGVRPQGDDHTCARV